MKKQLLIKNLIYILLSVFLGWNVYLWICNPNFHTIFDITFGLIILIGLYYEKLSLNLFSRNNEKKTHAYENKSVSANRKRELTNLFLETIPLPSYYIDIEDEVISTNKQFNKLVGIDSEDNISYNLNNLPPQINIKELLYGNETVINQNKTIIKECKSHFNSSIPEWYRIYKTPLMNNDNETVKGILVFIKDISAEKELSNQQERFIATLNHDLKTPVIAQMRSLEMLLNGNFGEISSDQKEILELTLNSCENIYNMVSTILSSYKLENNEINLNYTEINFNELVIECCDTMQKIADEKNIKFIIKPKTEKNMVCADEHYLKTAVLFLIENSISYSYQNSYIEISIGEQDNNLDFKILAKSPYIPEENLKSMLHKYMGQISNYNKIGFCMKLNYCNQVVKAHKGQIIASSSKNNENTLGFDIPLSIACSVNV